MDGKAAIFVAEGRDEMNKQTAIDLLDNLLGMVEDNHESDYDTAIKMGIDALKSNTYNALSALDCVARRAAIDRIESHIRTGDELYPLTDADKILNHAFEIAASCVYNLPSVQQTLFGYKIEHLAYIARVMEKEGVTAEYAVRTFDDMSRAVRMIIEEAQQKAEEMLYERLDRQTGGD